MHNYYGELYDEFFGKSVRCGNEIIEFENLSFFVPIVGDRYDGCKNVERSDFRMMLVGRAVNGWEKVGSCTRADFMNDITVKLDGTRFSDAIYEQNDRLYFNKKYSLSGSAFWRTAKKVWVGLGGVAETRWVDNIIWSNLYKVSPSRGGNPKDEMCDVQHLICKRLLKEEIEFYRPTHIFLIAGLNWVENSGDNSFISNFKKFKKTGNENAVGVAFYEFIDGKRIPVVIGRRPEYHNEAKYTEDILKAFNMLKHEL